MNVVEDGQPILLGKLKPGSLFKFNNTIALKTEYVTEQFATTAYIIGSGEMFWGGVNSMEELHNLLVQPLSLRE